MSQTWSTTWWRTGHKRTIWIWNTNKKKCQTKFRAYHPQYITIPLVSIGSHRYQDENYSLRLSLCWRLIIVSKFFFKQQLEGNVRRVWQFSYEGAPTTWVSQHAGQQFHWSQTDRVSNLNSFSSAQTICSPKELRFLEYISTTLKLSTSYTHLLKYKMRFIQPKNKVMAPTCLLRPARQSHGGRQ